MIFYGNTMSGLSGKRARGVAVGRLGGFGAFAGGGRIVFGPFSFAESWSSDDFGSAQQFNNWVKPYLDQVGRVGMTYDPPSPSLIKNAEAKWALWQAAADMGDQNAQAYMDQFRGQMVGLINRGDQLSLTGSHRSESIEVQRYDTFNEIVKLMKQMSGSAIPAQTIPVSQSAATTVLTGQVGTPSSIVDQITAALTGASTRPVSTSNAPPLVAMTNGPDWVLPAAIGGGGLIFLGLLFTLVRKKKASAPALAGYRRRRRR